MHKLVIKATHMDKDRLDLIITESEFTVYSVIISRKTCYIYSSKSCIYHSAIILFSEMCNAVWTDAPLYHVALGADNKPNIPFPLQRRAHSTHYLQFL